MPTEKAPWFVIERSEALAGVVLTSRKDLAIQREIEHEDGVDFLVAATEREPLPTRLFVVQVRGTMSSDPAEWPKTVKEIFQPKSSPIFLPVCVFVVNVRDNSTRYAWMAEPSIEAQQAKLRFSPTPIFHDLDQ